MEAKDAEKNKGERPKKIVEENKKCENDRLNMKKKTLQQCLCLFV